MEALSVGAKESFDFWRSKGLAPAQAAGLVGMEQGESNFTPNARGDGGKAHGAFQWHPDRRAKILAGTGIDIDHATHAQQLQAAYWEMTKGSESYTGFWKRLQKARTAGEAAALGVYMFERPKGKAGEARLRGGYANAWLGRFGAETPGKALSIDAKALAEGMKPKVVIPKAQDISPASMAGNVEGVRAGDAMMGATHHHHGPVSIQLMNPPDNPDATAKAVNKALSVQMNRRAHDVAFDYA
jgi:hypothetical protein